MTIRLENADPNCNDYALIIQTNKILYLDKPNDTGISRIHLINGEILESTESLNTIQAKIDSIKEN
jgi:hypothetical protein